MSDAVEPSTLELLERLARARAPVMQIIAALRGRDDLVPQAIARVRSGDEATRAMALVALREAATQSELDARQVWPQVLATLHDPTPRVRALGAHLLASHPPAADALEDALADTNASVRSAALSALMQIDPARTLAAVQARLTQGDPQHRAATLRSLARQLPEPATPASSAIVALARAGLDDADPALREAAVALLARDPRAGRELLLATAHDAHEPVRLAAVLALLGIADEVPTATLTALLHDPSSRVRGAALMILGEGNHRSACLAIRPLLADAAVRTAAIRAASRLGCTQLVDDLIPLIEAGSTVQRSGAIRAVGQLLPNANQLPPSIVAALDDPAPQIRAAALSVCRDAAHLLPRLRQAALADPVSEVRRAAVLAVTTIADPRAAEVLLAALDDAEPSVSVTAARSLGRLGISAALPRLRALADDASIEVRAAIEWARRRLEPEAFAPLAEALQKLSDPGTRGVPSTTWYPRAAAHRPLERLIVHLTGLIEAIDIDGEAEIWRTELVDEALLVRNDDGRASRLEFELLDASQPAPGFELRLSSDPFFGYAPARFYAPDPGRARDGQSTS